jgi:tRNA dimethylallyltransferase
VKPHVLFIVGPTACGKSQIAIEVARQLHCEIISADSMLVYRGMDIGTAKPSAEARHLVPHHMIDILEPTQTFSVFEYRQMAIRIIGEITARKKIPLVVGGTGLYIRALQHGLVKTPGPDIHVRKGLETEAETNGLDSLYRRLAQQDPLRAAAIERTDKRRIIRALEIAEKENTVTADCGKVTRTLDELGYTSLLVGLRKDRNILYQDIENRVNEMFEEGLVEEVRNICEVGISNTASQAVGYKEVIEYLNGILSLNEARDLIKKNSRHLAKRQLTWFRREFGIRWFDIPFDEAKSATVGRVASYFAANII